MRDTLEMIAGADQAYVFDASADLTNWQPKASLTYADGSHSETLIVGAGIVKALRSFTVTFTAAQTEPAGQGSFMNVQLYSGGKLQLQAQVALRVENNLIP